MAKHPWLTRRGSVYYLRAPVPKDIRDTFGKSEVVLSLRTSERALANRLINMKANEVAEQFEAHRRTGDGPVPDDLISHTTFDPATLQRLCDQHYRKITDQHFAWRNGVLNQARGDVEGFFEGKYIPLPNTEWYLTFFEELTLEQTLVVSIREETKTRLSAIEHALEIGDCTGGEAVADEAISSRELAVNSDDRLVVIRRLMETEAQALSDFLAKYRERYEKIVSKHSTESAPGVTPPGGAPATPTDPGPRLKTLIPKFSAEGERAGLVLKTTQSDQADLREFVEVVGDRPIRTYTKVHGTKFKSTLLATPAQRKGKPFAGLTILEAAQLADKQDPQHTTIQRLHADTINNKLMVVRKFFTWADAQLSNVPNPIDGLRIKAKRQRGRKIARRYPFRTDELQKLFNGPIYRGCSSTSWKKPGDLIPRDSARFWAPLIALYTGMRMGEIIQLRVEDIKTHDNGIVYFAVTTLVEDDDGEADKSTKNENSIRDVPVHPMLFECGLQHLIDQRRQARETRLLMDYDRSPTDGSWSKTFSAWFRQYRKHVGVERIVGNRNRVDFHSFRHLFEDVVRDLPDVKKEFRDALQGHGESGVSAEYGLGPALQRLDDAIKKVSYPGLDLAHLRAPPENLNEHLKSRSLAALQQGSAESG